ncbi:hypothetical protein NL676_015616 [Syzygium grande]|nr:hypothetical protein NL676_015616 [Syzygium grande]
MSSWSFIHPLALVPSAHRESEITFTKPFMKHRSQVHIFSCDDKRKCCASGCIQREKKLASRNDSADLPQSSSCADQKHVLQ